MEDGLGVRQLLMACGDALLAGTCTSSVPVGGTYHHPNGAFRVLEIFERGGSDRLQARYLTGQPVTFIADVAWPYHVAFERKLEEEEEVRRRARRRRQAFADRARSAFDSDFLSADEQLLTDPDREALSDPEYPSP